MILDRVRALPAAARDLAQLVAVVPTRAEDALVADAAEQVDCASLPACWCPRTPACRTGTRPCGVVEDPCRRFAEPSCTGECSGYWPSCRTPTLGGWSTTGGWRATMRWSCASAGSRAGRPPARAHTGRRPGTSGRPAAAAECPGPERAEPFEQYADEAHLTGANEEGSAGPRRGACHPRAVRRRRANRREPPLDLAAGVVDRSGWTGCGRRRTRLEVLAGLPPSQALAMMYIAQAQLRYRVNDRAASAAWADRAVDLADELGEGEIALHAAITRDTARLGAGDLAARTSLERPTKQPGKPVWSIRRPGPWAAWPRWSPTSSPGTPRPRS